AFVLVRRHAAAGLPLSTGATSINGGAYLTAFAVNPSAAEAVALWGDSGRLFDVKRGANLAALPGGASPFECLAFAAGGKALITGGDGAVRFWSVDDRPDFVLTPAAAPA